ncbi:phosphoribosylformylglycinamidine synthase I [Candidatus Peregrinibacteria bacterium]|nr:phosphoribosylformylglycinamidine synthase I [Candidatus Peregrinibacteria bacterium]
MEIGFLPGVTDNTATTAKETIEDFFKMEFENEESVHSSMLILIKGKLKEPDMEKIGESLSNNLIQQARIKSRKKFVEEKGMGIIVPVVHIHSHPKADIIDLNISEEELIKLGKEGIKNEDGTRRGPLALEKDYLHTIKEYFKKEGRNPTDIELESIAQTWSEHCKHTIFAAKIDDNENGLYKGYIKKATQEIREQKGKKDFCVSVFSDNAGGILFDENWVITDKAETHNSPSALDPFGGAITGIVGVNRDTIGFGKGAKPIINKYGFCAGLPSDEDPIYRDKELKNKAISPSRILEGVIDGVNTGGNCSGIPTPQGFIYFDESYKGKPLIFVGTVGLIPKTIKGKPSWEKKANKGDKIVVVGGRVGKDGIHGATFSSEALTSGSPATAVQIGDPITQKKFSDAIVKEARELELYSSITDNGAGGISCSVSEMAKESGGCEVELNKVPLKYPNLSPWEIWISESQERMTLAVPPNKLKTFTTLMKKRGVETAEIGTFTDSGRCIVKYNGEKIMDMEMDFLHNGLPKKTIKTKYTKQQHKEPNFDEPKDITQTLLEMLSRPNICSYDFISTQYDHTVQGNSILQPLQGKGKVNSPASITKPFPESDKGIICSQGINAKYSQIDTYHMAACAIDTAVRNIISVGGTLDHLALMDNFCWCSSNEEEKLGQLKAACEACYDYATSYGTPFISGKDSMFNDFKGFDKEGNPIKISVLPTLLISSLGVINDITKSVSLDPKFAGDLIYILGETKNELGGSEYFSHNKTTGNTVPKVDKKNAKKLYKKFTEATGKKLISSSLSPQFGGLISALAKKAIAGKLGMELDLSNIPMSEDLKSLNRFDYILFSETQSRFIVTIDPKRQKEFEEHFKDIPFAKIGVVTDDQNFIVKNLIKTNIETLDEYYRKTFREPLKNDGLQGNKELPNESRSETNNLALPVVRRSELTNKELYGEEEATKLTQQSAFFRGSLKNMLQPKVLVITGYGINCEEETAKSFMWAGGDAEIVHINDIINKEKKISDYQIMAFPGGFSYGDDTGSGNALANKIKNNLEEEIFKFAKEDKLIIGICNGMQILANLGLIPAACKKYGERQAALMRNLYVTLECRWTYLKNTSNKCVWTRDIDMIHLPIAHGEGNFYVEENILEQMKKDDQIVFKYVKEDGSPSNREFPFNPNGAMEDISGVCDPTGKIFALMPHPERFNSFENEDGWELKKERLIRASGASAQQDEQSGFASCEAKRAYQLQASAQQDEQSGFASCEAKRAYQENKTLPKEGDGIMIFKNGIKYFK